MIYPGGAGAAGASVRPMPSLSVIVPATDRPPTLDRCRAAIVRAAGSPDLLVIDGPAGLPVCVARNAGAERATGDVLVFVDSDVEIHRDALTRIAEHFATDPELTAVFGSYDDAPARGGAVAAFRNLLHHHVHQHAAGPAETFWTGLGAVRRDAFRAAGGDQPGARIRLDPAIQGTHLKAWTLGSMVHTDFARRGVPWVALLLRGGHRSTALNLGWRHRLSAAACSLGAVTLLARRPLPTAAALLALLALNHDFYRLLARRRGPGEALLGVGLHAIHHLTAVAAVPGARAGG